MNADDFLRRISLLRLNGEQNDEGMPFTWNAQDAVAAIEDAVLEARKLVRELADGTADVDVEDEP
jgi:hypothetical protein